MTKSDLSFPKLRAVDPRLIVHEGRPLIMLRDPLQLTENILLVPQQMAPLLALCDGTRENARALSLAFALRFGVMIDERMIEQLLAALDQALLLDNHRFREARSRALDAYHQLPFRPPALAGKAYPAEADDLKRMLEGFVDGIVEPQSSIGRGVISPHIDYARGGPVYARVWKRAAKSAREADLVVLLGTDHYGGDSSITLTRQSYATPFGVLPTARKVVDALAEALGEEAAFAGEFRHRSEHSIELASIWLHYIRDGQPVEMVPILCGSFARFIHTDEKPESDAQLNSLLRVLEEKTAGRRVMIVAAADLAHVGPAFGGEVIDLAAREELKESDGELVELMKAGDAEGFFGAIKRVEDRNNVCGVSPIYLALRLLANARGESVAYDRCPADQDMTSFVSVCGVVLD
ncbi:MAG: AmmeMemoRadiSam system protein B [Acidobacteriota bacterium]